MSPKFSEAEISGDFSHAFSADVEACSANHSTMSTTSAASFGATAKVSFLFWLKTHSYHLMQSRRQTSPEYRQWTLLLLACVSSGFFVFQLFDISVCIRDESFEQ